MGISIERNGFISNQLLAASVMKDLADNGFIVKHPGTGISTSELNLTKTATLEPTVAIDPLIATQPWRLRIKSDAATDEISMQVATPLQLPDDGTVSKTGSNTESGSLDLSTSGTGNRFAGPKVWAISTQAQPPAFPMSYRLSISDHGFILFMWVEGSDMQGNQFSWVVVQRPVNPQTGEPLITGKAPVFCVYSTRGGGSAAGTLSPTGIRRFTVRESDIYRPTDPRPALMHSIDHNAIINPLEQVAITENNQYVITFPNGLNTGRYSYTEEIDLIGYTSADVISAWSDIELTMYGEAAPRVYKAMQANGPNNTGMRILMQIAGKGITPAA